MREALIALLCLAVGWVLGRLVRRLTAIRKAEEVASHQREHLQRFGNSFPQEQQHDGRDGSCKEDGTKREAHPIAPASDGSVHGQYIPRIGELRCLGFNDAVDDLLNERRAIPERVGNGSGELLVGTVLAATRCHVRHRSRRARRRCDRCHSCAALNTAVAVVTILAIAHVLNPGPAPRITMDDSW